MSNTAAKNLINDFSIAADISCKYFNIDEQGCYSCSRFCERVKHYIGKDIDCGNAMLYGVYQAELFNGRYIFYCPLGLVNFVSPVFEEKAIVGYAAGGPLLMISHDEYIYEDLLPIHKLPQSVAEELLSLIADIPAVPPRRVTALSNTLAGLCERLSNAQEENDSADIGRYLNYISTMGGGTDLKEYPLQTEKELLSMITLCDIEGARRLLNQLLSQIYLTCGNDLEMFKSRILELVVLLSRAAVEGGANAEEIFGMNYRFLGEIHEHKSFDRINQWLSGILKRFTDCIFNITDVKNSDIIFKATNYIKQNYANPITLEDVAKSVYLSNSYFSKVFNKSVGESFSSYLNKVRIENSKRMLLKSNQNLTQISINTGFGDQSYFTKVFKKVVGVSPGKFRELRGNLTKLNANSNSK